MATDYDSKVVLFADDTMIIIISPNQGLQIALTKISSDINSLFTANFLSLNLDKTYNLQFRTKRYIDNILDIKYLNTPVANVPYTKFLGMVVDDTLSWNNHIDQLISRLNSACCAIRPGNAILSKKVLRMLYFSYVHSITSYGIIFGGKTPNSILRIRIQKKVLRIINKSNKTDSCTELFKTTEILPL